MVLPVTKLAHRLRDCSLFAGLDDSMLNALTKNARSHNLADGTILFEQDARAKDIFFLESGQIKLSRISPSGQEKIIELVSPGDSFAEAVMFSEQQAYPVAATAIGPCRVCAINSQFFSGILSQSSEACFNIMAELSRRLHQQVMEIDHLTLHNAADRLVFFLLNQCRDTVSGSSNVHLDMKKQVLASRLSIAPETLSRTLAKLRKDGLIAQDSDNIFIQDINRLRRYAER